MRECFRYLEYLVVLNMKIVNNGEYGLDFTLLTDNLQIADLTDHRIRINLTHIVASIVLMSLTYMQHPCVRIVKGNAVPGNS